MAGYASSSASRVKRLDLGRFENSDCSGQVFAVNKSFTASPRWGLWTHFAESPLQIISAPTIESGMLTQNRGLGVLGPQSPGGLPLIRQFADCEAETGVSQLAAMSKFVYNACAVTGRIQDGICSCQFLNRTQLPSRMIGMGYPESLSLSGGLLPIKTGNLLDFPEDPIACMRKLHAELGDVAVLEDQGQRIGFVFSPEYNRLVLSNSNTFHSQFFAIRGGRRSAQRRVTSGLLSMNGSEHRDSRRVMMDVFTRRILPEYHQTISNLTEELMSDWEVGQHHDLNTEMVHFMLRMTSALLFGIDDAAYSVELGTKIDQWVRKNHEVGMGAFVSAPQFTDMYDELLTMADDLEASIKEMFSKHRASNHEGQRTDVLSLMFKAQASEQQLKDEKLVGHATLTFAAAHLTTAHTFSWTLFLLAQHPNVMERLATELAENTTGSTPTYEELQNCTYLEWVIKESMRVLPASSYSQRITTEPAQLGPLNLPQGTPVIFSQFMTHHRADLFDEPDVFRPERWADISPGAYEYLPFGAGPRMCIGAPLAMVELRTALAVMLKKFHFQMQADSVVDGRVISTMLGPTSTLEATLLSPSETAATVPVRGSVHDLVQLPAEAQPKTIRRAA